MREGRGKYGGFSPYLAPEEPIPPRGLAGGKLRQTPAVPQWDSSWNSRSRELLARITMILITWRDCRLFTAP